MIINELYIENFGKLSKYKKSFTEGLNHFVEDNGFGKTTLTVFIKVMLYGFDDTRRHSLDENDRKKYTPWQGGAFGGWLSFSVGGKNYRVERSFGAKISEDTFTLYNLDTGTYSSDFSDPIGESIFGIDADGFERTVFLSEKNLSGKNTNPTISAKLSNLVGTEGDIGEFDEAIKLLEDRRRFYQKKGGAGEIADAKRDISEIEDELRVLKEKKESLVQISERTADITVKINAIKEKKEKILEEQRTEIMAKEKRGYEIQYSEMLGALKIDEKRESELLKFFEKKLPTNAEIASVAESISELKRIEKNLASISENRELAELSDFFRAPTNQEECETMREKARRLTENRTLLFAKKESLKEIRSPFINEPTYNDIDRHTMAIGASGAKSKSHKGIGALIGVIGLILLCFALTIGKNISPVLCYTSAIPGILLIIVGILALSSVNSASINSDSEANALKFISTVYGKVPTDESILSALISMRGELDRHLAAKAAIKSSSEEILTLEALLEREEREVRNYLEKFPELPSITYEEATIEILRKHHRYSLLLEYERERDSERGANREKIKRLQEYANSFLSLFNTSTSEPIAEIRRNLAEFDVLRSSLTRRRGDAERFASLHGISAQKISVPLEAPVLSDFKELLSSVDEELILAEREKAKLILEHKSILSDIERIDELEEKLLEKNDQVSLYEDNLSVINKAKEFLASARDSMTAKYLDKTRQGFRKYITLINEECGDFTIDTTFSISKTELGKSRQAEAYSRGTRDLHSLAIRLSLLDALYDGELPPIILDDPFIAFDDKHIDRAISVIKRLSDKRQIFYFTCSKSRRAK